MAYSKIIITQSAVSGAAGVSRNDLVLFTGANPVTFTNDADGSLDVTTWLWTLVERPPGSVATLAGAATSTASLQPDVNGRYVVSLRVNGLGDSTNGYSEIVASVPFTSLGTDYLGEAIGDYNPPGAFEKFLGNWGGNNKGAQPEIYKLFKNMRQIVMPAILGFKNAVDIPVPLPSSLTQSTNAGAAQVAGYTLAFDMADMPWVKAAKFYAVFGRNGGAGTAEVELYDVTNTVSVATMTTTSALTESTAALTIGAAAGNLRDDGDTRYSIRVRMSVGGGGVDLAEIYSAGVRLEIV